jgi:HEAT repeat protein
MFARLAPATLALVLIVAGCSPDIDRMRDERDSVGLIDALRSDSSAEVRADAAAALGELGAADARSALIDALDDPDPMVRATAARALGELGSAAAVEPLLNALEDESPDVRRAAQESLNSIAPTDAGAFAEGGFLDAFLEALKDESPTIRAAAAIALADAGSPAAILPLLIAADDESAEVRGAAEPALSFLLSSFDPAAVRAPLLEALRDDRPTVRAAAARALGEFGDATALAPLLEALEDEVADVRDAAGSAVSDLIGGLGDDEAVTALVEGLRSERPTAREAAGAALRELLATMPPADAVAVLNQAGADDAWLAIALGVPKKQIATETRRLGIQLEPLDSITQAVAPIRDGTPVAVAHPYRPSDGFHPAIVLERQREFDEASPWPPVRDLWAPTALRFTELVIVEDEVNWQSIEVCLYNGPSITRYRGSATVRVLSAVDGQLVAEQTFEGTDPRVCEPTENYNLTELYGDAPDLSQAIPWLESLINPPGG